jgi:hypothetical protein
MKKIRWLKEELIEPKTPMGPSSYWSSRQADPAADLEVQARVLRALANSKLNDVAVYRLVHYAKDIDAGKFKLQVEESHD